MKSSSIVLASALFLSADGTGQVDLVQESIAGAPAGQ